MEVFRAVLIHLVVPAAGLFAYLWLCRKMLASEIEQPPLISLFVIFATYGGWLLEVLTLNFWYWSGMALLGAIYLLFAAPLVMIVLAVLLYPKRKMSVYHYGSFVASTIYILIPVIVFASMAIYSK